MFTWKLLVPVAAAFMGAGISALAVVQQLGFSCTVPWYKDTTCGIPKLTIPPKGYAQIEVVAVTKNGEKWTGLCPVFNYYDAKTDKLLHFNTSMCDGGLGGYVNPSKDSDAVIYVRVNVGENKDVDIRGNLKVFQ